MSATGTHPPSVLLLVAPSQAGMAVASVAEHLP